MFTLLSASAASDVYKRQVIVRLIITRGGISCACKRYKRAVINIPLAVALQRHQGQTGREEK